MKSFNDEHEGQAEKFLLETKTTFKCKFKTYGKHFDDDKENRNIYRITLKRNNRQYSFNFGQSLNGTAKNEEPTAYDVLSCLQKYDVGSFEDFCSEFGYDSDSRKAEKTYYAVLKEYQNVNYLFNDVIEKLQAVQ